MPDRVNYSDSSLLITNGRLLTNNADQSIQAYDTATGRLVWYRRLAGYDRSLRLVDGSLMVFDYMGSDYTYSMVFLDPFDGSEQNVITPSCPTSEFSSDTMDPDSSGFLYDETENAAYLVYDSSPGCIQRLDLATGQPSWYTLDEGWYTFSADGFQGLLTADYLYFSTRNKIQAVEKATGQLQTLLSDNDYELLPMAVRDNVLLVRMRRTRGTETFELRGISTETGRMLWRLDMGTAEPIDQPDRMVGLVDKEDTGWTWHLGETGGFVLIRFQGEPNQMIIQFYNLTDGSLVGETTVPLKSVSGDFYSAPEVIAWSGDFLYLSVDGDIYCINVPAGEVVFHT
jgi:outer membrane protein assembly factor BamB